MYRPAMLHRLAESIPGVLKRLQGYRDIVCGYQIRLCWEVKSKVKRLFLPSNRQRTMEATRWKTIRWTWERICKRLRSPGFDSKEAIPPAYVARRACSSNKVSIQARQAENRFLGSSKVLQIRALEMVERRNRQSMEHRVHRVATATF